MLVKLGDIWVEPSRVSAIGLDKTSGNVGVIVDGICHFPKNISTDECAGIVNNFGQSFGGEDEKNS